MEQSIEVKTDQYGIVDAPVHDGRVIKLVVDGRASLSFTIRGVRGEKVIFTLHDLVELRILSFGLEPICSAVFCWELANAVPMTWEASDNPWTILFGELNQGDAIKARERLIASHANHKLIALSCVYGGDLAAVCSELNIVRVVED